MGKLIGDADQICGYGFSSTYLGNKANKRAHQVMKHKVPFIAANTILKDAKHSLEQLNEDYLIVMNEDKPLGCVTWKILATVESIEIDSHGYL